jgi:hypothetical protein
MPLEQFIVEGVGRITLAESYIEGLTIYVAGSRT